MSDKQIWMTIALDLKRGANYLYLGENKKAKYFLEEAKRYYESQTNKIEKINEFIKFEGEPEDILLGSSLITSSII